MKIRIITKKDGRTVLDKIAKPNVPIPEVLEIAECEVYGGYADSAQVFVDGKLYAEYEA